MRDVIGVRERVVEQARKFYPSTVIYVEALDPFKSAPNVTQEEGSEVSTLNSSTWFYFVCIIYFLQRFPIL